MMTLASADTSTLTARTIMTKARRVRTGCLTCRQRHLKCDEAIPDCLNCRKSNRQCKRGVRLNFLDVVVHVPVSRPPASAWAIEFQDESRQVASEYRGGLKRYTHVEQHTFSGTGAKLRVVLRPQDESTRWHAGSHDVSASSKVADCPLNKCLGVNAAVEATNAPDITKCSLKSRGTALARNSESKHELDNSFGPSSQLFSGTGDTPRRKRAEEATCNLHTTSVGSHAGSIQDTSTGVPRVLGKGRQLEAHVGVCSSPLLTNESDDSGEREFLRSPDELRYMRVFVEEVGVWMDLFDPDKHFSQLVPYQALKSPILLNSFLACGVKHLALARPGHEEQALFYYNTATTQLLRNLQNPDRNTAECATAAVILNVYEVMSKKPAQHMNHIAGARALIRDCGWNAGSAGTGLACFWLNIALEVLSCLAMNCSTTWNPDDWGLDMAWTKNEGREEGGRTAQDDDTWVHRAFYALAKIANFRASAPLFLDDSPHQEQMKLGDRFIQWQELKGLSDSWNKACPRTMHPIGYLNPEEANSGGGRSLFPKVWLIKRQAILGRLLYHCAQCLLTQTNPVEPAQLSGEMHALQLHHAHQVCGIVAQVEDGAVSAVAIRSLELVSYVLSKRSEQLEVLDILARIHLRKGWYLGTVEQDLKAAWQWTDEKPVHEHTGGDWSESQARLDSQVVPPSYEKAHGGRCGIRAEYSSSTPHGAPSQMPGALEAAVANVSNPLGSADFNLPNRPYQNWYERPSRGGSWETPLF